MEGADPGAAIVFIAVAGPLPLLVAIAGSAFRRLIQQRHLNALVVAAVALFALGISTRRLLLISLCAASLEVIALSARDNVALRRLAAHNGFPIAVVLSLVVFWWCVWTRSDRWIPTGTAAALLGCLYLLSVVDPESRMLRAALGIALALTVYEAVLFGVIALIPAYVV